MTRPKRRFHPPYSRIPLTQAQITELRAQVACVGCGARRVDAVVKGKPTTRIHHHERCEVRALELYEARAEAIAGHIKAWSTRRINAA